MKVTKQNIKNELTRYFDIDSVEQIGSKQLFIVKLGNGIKLLVSYYTVIGVMPDSDCPYYLTDKKYSMTTSYQVSRFRSLYDTHIMAHSSFVVYLQGILNIATTTAEYLTSK